MRIHIYQTDDPKLIFQSYYEATNGGTPFLRREKYRCVFSGEIDAFHLVQVFQALNLGEKPEGYVGRSLSVSDVIEVDEPGILNGYWYVDNIGFKKIVWG